MIHSVSELLASEFEGKTLGSPGVHILDPFTGTGTFITRLIESGLISPTDLKRKYLGTEGTSPEIHANEILLLAYYIAAINIETAYQGVVKSSNYQPFPGICLTDTFGLHEKDDYRSEFFAENSKRRLNQKSQDVRVIIGNPPYSGGQKSANDQAANAKYTNLDERIRDTYVAHSTTNNNRSLYNSYIRTIRLGSDLIAKSGGGVMALVTDAGWLDSRSGAGLRKCIAREFSTVYVFHLRGQARGLSSERAKREGTNVFDQATRSPIAINFFIQNQNTQATKLPSYQATKLPSYHSAEIYFYRLDDYLSRHDKLKVLTHFKSLSGITTSDKWQRIIPDSYGDWFDQRDPAYANLLLLGDKRQKSQLQVFEQYSLGVQTNRDAWTYNPSKQRLLNNISAMINMYNHERHRLHAEHVDPSLAATKRLVSKDGSKIKWSRALYQQCWKNHELSFDQSQAVVSAYRPFKKRWLYFDRDLNEVVYQIPRLFPHDPSLAAGTRPNRVIVCSGVGSLSEWSVLMTDALPNLDLISKCQGFARYVYDPHTLERADNITDAVLLHFHQHYSTTAITKDDIFDYIYGILHSPEFRKRFDASLMKELPRVPLVESYDDFISFS